MCEFRVNERLKIKRLKNGAVLITIDFGDNVVLHVTIDSETWCSMVTAVAAEADSAETHERVLAIHKGKTPRREWVVKLADTGVIMDIEAGVTRFFVPVPDVLDRRQEYCVTAETDRDGYLIALPVARPVYMTSADPGLTESGAE